MCPRKWWYIPRTAGRRADRGACPFRNPELPASRDSLLYKAIVEAHMFDFLDSTELKASMAIIGGALGFSGGTKIRNYTGETSSPGICAVIGAVLFYLVAKYLAAAAIFIAAGGLLILVIVSWPTISRVILIFAQKLASMLPTRLLARSFHKQLAKEQLRLERELEQARSLNVDPRVKQRLLEKIETEGRNRLLDLADRSKKSASP
jgi:hypothetical protein